MKHNPTHIRDLAKLLAIESAIPYQKALQRTQRASEAGLLAPKFDQAGRVMSLSTLLTLERLDRVSASPRGAKEFVLGQDHQGAPFVLNERELSLHTMVLGSTGSGKTETLKTLVTGLLGLGYSGTLIDATGDTDSGGLADFLSSYASTHATPYQYLSLDDPSTSFDPLEGLGQFEVKTLLLSMIQIEDAYWRTAFVSLVPEVLEVVYAAHYQDSPNLPPLCLEELGRIFSNLPQSLEPYLAAARPSSEPTGLAGKTLFSEAKLTVASSLGDTISALYTSNSPWRSVPQKDVNLGALGKSSAESIGLTYIGADTLASPNSAALFLSTAVLQLTTLAHTRRTLDRADPHFILIHGAGAIDPGHLRTLLRRARGAQYTIILSANGPTDWPTLWNEITQNINVTLVMAQHTKRDAELSSELLGSAPGTTEALASPQELRELRVGEALVHIAQPYTTTWIRVHLSQP
jgi:hypothetical protein